MVAYVLQVIERSRDWGGGARVMRAREGEPVCRTDSRCLVCERPSLGREATQGSYRQQVSVCERSR